MPKQKEVSIREAAGRLKRGLGYIYHLVWAGKLPAIRRDGRWFVPVAAIEARMKAQEEHHGTSGR